MKMVVKKEKLKKGLIDEWLSEEGGGLLGELMDGRLARSLHVG